jgi:hypothetical protein
MSAKADIGTQSGNVCVVPKADIRLFDDFVGASEQRGRHNEAKRFRRL